MGPMDQTASQTNRISPVTVTSTAPRFLQIRLRHESRDKYVIHISKTAFKKNVILKRRITM